MAEEIEDPREVPWHPRFATKVVGHVSALQAFHNSFESGKPHHAWLITGPMGIGKATLAYEMTRHVLGYSMAAAQVARLIHGRAHPDVAVLERSFNDAKPRKLRSEISVDDARRFIDFFSRTSGGGGWRVGIVDTADDLNTESANALLKLIEEPPSKALIFMICHTPGRLLRTLRSRCRRLPLGTLSIVETQNVLQNLPLVPEIDRAKLLEVSTLSGGSPGFSFRLLDSEGAKAFGVFSTAKKLDAPLRNTIGQHFSSRAAAQQDYEVFMGLLLEWIADKAKSAHLVDLAALHGDLAQFRSVVAGYNLDRRSAVMEALTRIDLALKAA
jgi:DNA polymerase III subunit delta'